MLEYLRKIKDVICGARTNKGNIKIATAEALINLPIALKSKDSFLLFHTTTTLDANATVETGIVDVSKYSAYRVCAYASTDGVFESVRYSYAGYELERLKWQVHNYMRYDNIQKITCNRMNFRYINGATAQTKFELTIEVIP